MSMNENSIIMDVNRHRLNDEWLMQYAAGTADVGEELVISTYLKLVPEDIEKIEFAARLGGEMIAQLPETQLADDALERMFDRLDAQSSETVEKIQKIADGHTSHDNQETDAQSKIENILSGNSDQLNWQLLGPGLRKIPLWTGPQGQSLWLLKAKPGAKIPTHSHHGMELTLVLQGAYEDQMGRFAKGDVEEADDTIQHSLTIADDAECICLALTESPIVLKNWAARLLQRVVRF